MRVYSKRSTVSPRILSIRIALIIKHSTNHSSLNSFHHHSIIEVCKFSVFPVYKH